MVHWEYWGSDHSWSCLWGSGSMPGEMNQEDLRLLLRIHQAAPAPRAEVTPRKARYFHQPQLQNLGLVILLGRKECLKRESAWPLTKGTDFIFIKVWISLSLRVLSRIVGLWWKAIGRGLRDRLNCKSSSFQDRTEGYDSWEEYSWVKANIKHYLQKLCLQRNQDFIGLLFNLCQKALLK